MDIDWTKDVELSDGTPLRILCVDRPSPANTVLAMMPNGQLFGCNINGECSLTHHGVHARNVAPKPVRHEAWVNLYADGAGNLWRNKSDADEVAAYHDRIECRRIVWHSDGSPVEENLGDLSIIQMENQGLHERISVIERDNADLERDRDAWKAKAEEALCLLTDANTRRDQDIALIEKLDTELVDTRVLLERTSQHNSTWKSKLDAMVPVVDAAIALVKTWDHGALSQPAANLRAATEAYQKGEPEKSCWNCAHLNKDGFIVNAIGRCTVYRCRDMSEWEPRQ